MLIAVWVQALGSIGAICAAFYIGHRDRCRNNADRSMKEAVLAYAITPDFFKYSVFWRSSATELAVLVPTNWVG